MNTLKKSLSLLVLLTLIICSRVVAQDYFSSLNPFIQIQDSARTKAILQDNEYTPTGYEQGSFYDNPLMLNGMPFDYNAFNLDMKGELTVVKAAVVTGNTTKVPFYVYLKRKGLEIALPGNEKTNLNQTKIELSTILQHAKPGDLIVIQPIKREDGPAKTILKVPEGC